MGFFDKLNRAWSGLDFWDKQENAKQQAQYNQDEERKRREREARAQAQAQARTQQRAQQEQQQQQVINSFTRPNVTNNPTVQHPGRDLVKQPTFNAPKQEYKPATAQEVELNQLKEQNMAQALKEAKSRTSWFDRQFTNRNWDKQAESVAMQRATRDYQDKYGWNRDQGVLDYNKQARNKLDEAQQNAASQWIAPVLSAGRVGTGIVQGGAGLYDLLTPGEGTNRVSKATDKKAKEIDQLASDLDMSGTYKVGNTIGEVASYLIPGTLAAKGAKAVAGTAKGASAVNKGAKYVDYGANLLDKGGDANKVRQFIAARMRQNFTLEEIMQELMITGRYMGQNTGRGGDTSWQSIATDALMGVGGGLLVPARGFKHLFDSTNGTATASDDVAGAALTGTADAVDSAITKPDIPVKPDVPVKPDIPEVSPGIKSPNLANNPVQGTQPVDVPTGTVDNTVVQQPQQQAPVTQTPVQQTVPTEPVVQPEVAPQSPYQPVTEQLPQKPVAEAPPVQQVVPESNPIETPNVAQSKEVAQATPVNVPEQAVTPPQQPARGDGLDELRGRREALMNEREARISEGYSTKDIDRQIARLDSLISSKASAPTKEAEVLAEGDQQLAEATSNATYDKKPEISKQEAPSKPKSSEDGVKTKQMSPEEMKAAGMSDEAIANVMAKRAESEAPNFTVVEGEGKTAGFSDKDTGKAPITDNPSVPKSEAPKTVKEPKAPKVVATEPEVPKAPTQRQLNKAVLDAPTTKSGKVTAAWKKQQEANGATKEQIAKAVEKVEGKKVEPTAEEKMTKERRAAINKAAREKKKADEAAGLTDTAAPKVTKNAAKEFSAESENNDIKNSIGRLFTAHFKKINIDTELKEASDKVDAVSDNEILKYAEDFLSNPENLSDSRYMILGAKINSRLGRMFREGKLSDSAILDVASKIEQSKAFSAANSGQTQRIVRELYNSVPSNVRVDRELKKIDEQLKAAGIDKSVKYTDADREELISHTNDFDSAATDINGLEVEMATAMSDLADSSKKLSDKEVDELWKKFDDAEKAYTAAQKKGLEASQAYAAKVKSIKPPLTKTERVKQWALATPDVGGNYLRMAMLSAPSGRVRDVISTSLNVVDQLGWRLLETGIGKGVNTVTRKATLMDTMGSAKSFKKGFFGGLKKVKSSYSGEPTLEEALGKTPNVDRSELAAKDSISTFGTHRPKKSNSLLSKVARAPKSFIRASVQASTDLSYGVYTDRLYGIGMQKAEQAGLTGKRAKKYAEMFMNQPDEASIKKAASTWLENSGMHDNFVTTGLKKITDGLDEIGAKSKYGPKHPKAGQTIPTANRVAAKATATAIRTTTIPFVQYMGGAFHAMAIKQNPIANVSKAAVSAAKKDPQGFVENLSRGVWNTAKIGTLMAVIEAGGLEISDTDADGKSTYNAPYVKKDGKFIPASTFGIAAGSAIIAAHYTKKAMDDFKEGNISGVVANSTIGPLWAIIKSSGLDNTISGENVLGGIPAKVSQTYSNAKNGAEDLGATLLGGLIGDFGTQATPAVLRDINTWFDANDSYNPTHEKPDTSGKDPETGKVNPIQKGVAQVKSGVPVWSQELPRKSGELARDFPGRVLNANTQSDQQKAEISAGKKEEATSSQRTADVVKDDKLKGLLSEETRAIYDKYKGDMSKASKSDNDKIWKDISDSKKRLLDDGAYSSYSKVLTYERDEAKAKGSKSDSEIAEMTRDITRVDVADKNKVNPKIYRMYTGQDSPEGGGISNSEFRKMIDEDDTENYDFETATALWELDKKMTEAGVSSNTNGMDPWTRQKYSMPKDKTGSKSGWGSGGGSGGKDPGIGTDFGTIGSFGKPSNGDPTQKYKKLVGSDNPLPNLTSSSSKTKLRKNISVAKGVRL